MWDKKAFWMQHVAVQECRNSVPFSKTLAWIVRTDAFIRSLRRSPLSLIRVAQPELTTALKSLYPERPIPPASQPEAPQKPMVCQFRINGMVMSLDKSLLYHAEVYLRDKRRWQRRHDDPNLIPPSLPVGYDFEFQEAKDHLGRLTWKEKRLYLRQAKKNLPKRLRKEVLLDLALNRCNELEEESGVQLPCIIAGKLMVFYISLDRLHKSLRRMNSLFQSR
jgi:hypothetical protein